MRRVGRWQRDSSMKLRTQLTLAFLVLAVVPLAGIVLYTYSSSQRAFRRGIEAETAAMTGELEGRMEAIRADLKQLVEELVALPLPLLVTAQGVEGGSGEGERLSRDRGDVYYQLVEGMGEAAAFVESFELIPVIGGQGRAAPSGGLIIFPSEALANALRKLERYRGVDPQTSAAVREALAPTLRDAIRQRSRLTESELQAIEASAQRSRRILGSDVRSPIVEHEKTIGYLEIRVRPLPILRRVLAQTRREAGEVPYALDSEGNLYAADPADKERLADLVAQGIAEGRPTLNGSSKDWIFVETEGGAASASEVGGDGVVFGMARPIRASLAGMRSTAVRNFAAGLGIVGLASLGMLLLSARLTRSVRTLTVGAERLARGDLQVRVPEGSKDELGQLARTFNRMAHELSVKEERLLEEERWRKDQEMQQRLLEAENRRKTEELEEARRFQMSLLPKAVPNLSWLDIAVHMRTASEVGGDYYDFFESGNGTLVTAVGDATGHGSRAGTMATVIKGMLSLGTGSDLPAFLKEANAAICGMRLERMSMSLTLARIEGRRLTIAAAGMPPALMLRAESGEVEEVVLEGTPLGGLSSFEYPEWGSELNPGDTLLLMTDGLPELLDQDHQPMGYHRVRSIFQDAAHQSPSEIVQSLSAAATEWNGGVDPNDDLTFVVMKATSESDEDHSRM